MKLTFEPNLDYQLQAISSVVNIFEGHPKDDEGLSFSIIDKNETQLFREINGVGNKLIISNDEIYKNLSEIQKANELPITSKEEFEKNRLNFTVEMETGTGKTFICELLIN
ncbi:MAG TPA: hypothetical protein P5270_02170 [Victivallales bacterium]|nr:hypothetical protein [Victivallales bacterium]HRU00997.1 hypothetical protein [Victivallales bacterium]